MEEDYHLYFPQYERDYGNGSFYHDYHNLFFKDFYLKIYNLQGDYKEIIRLRNLRLNGKRTSDNKDDFNKGDSLITKHQREQLSNVKESTTREFDGTTYYKNLTQEIYKQKGWL